MSRMSRDSKACVDDDGLIHATVGPLHRHTVCRWMRMWREQTPGGMWKNYRWKLVKNRMVTCLACISFPTHGMPTSLQIPLRHG